MSFDAKSELLAGLRADASLVTLCTGGFHNRKAKDVNAYPRIVYTELNNADDSFVDNQAISSEVRFQISIFTNDATVSKETPIAKEVDKTMKTLGYSRYSSVDLLEDSQVFHKAMRYQKVFNN
ncbi:tail completion protein gp17 [Metabacillus fastidiosus]|uniref:tail completion protein gp17 n=1 Tax=Metabacillus fastidiosus TaxID=1458 RepID=UPI003D2C6EF3